MNGVGLATAGKLPGHRRRATTAIYAHLDDAALRDVGYRAAPPALPDEADGAGIGLGEPARPAPLDYLDCKPGAVEDGVPPKPRRFPGPVRI